MLRTGQRCAPGQIWLVATSGNSTRVVKILESTGDLMRALSTQMASQLCPNIQLRVCCLNNVLVTMCCQILRRVSPHSVALIYPKLLSRASKSCRMEVGG